MTSSLPPAPLTSVPGSHRTPRAISVLVEQLPSGGYRLSTPHARGWAATCSTPTQLATALHHAYREATIAAYARAKGAVYDLDQLTGQVVGDVLAGGTTGRARRPRTTRRAAHSPADWSMADNGSWRSPSGRIYGPETLAVQRVKAKRTAMGLPS